MEEHCIDMKGTLNLRHPEIVIKLNEAISELHSFHPDCRIHRVSEGIRRAKPEAYEPIVVSIGPYHLKNPKLQAMKNHKLWYLRLLLERTKENVEKYIVEMEKLEDKVRNCYVEPIHDLNGEEFVEMMLLDACFIIEFFRKKPINPILDVDCMEDQIFRDLMLLENQLPFFLLSHFYDMIKNPDDDPKEYPDLDPENSPNNWLLRLALSSFLKFIPPSCLKYWELAQINDLGEIKHLLNLVHVFCCPLPNQKESLKLINSKDDKLDDILNPIHSAVELEEAGVKFKVFGNNYSSNLFDIKFVDGLMELPLFCVDHGTDTFFRNLIAFEQHSKDIVPRYFTEYADFMDQLISSEKDVKLLRGEGIIVNYLGDDKEVSNLFNKLRDGIIVPAFPTSYVNVRKKTNRHYNKPRNIIRATLARAHDFFDTPWATASTIAGGVLLVLTLLQTIAAFTYK